MWVFQSLGFFTSTVGGLSAIEHLFSLTRGKGIYGGSGYLSGLQLKKIHLKVSLLRGSTPGKMMAFD